MTKGLPDYRGYKAGSDNDYRLVKHLHAILSQADIVVAHNGIEFDCRKINARFSYYGIPPPKPYKVVDTLRVARHHFAFDSNKLDDLGDFLKLGRKIKHEGFELWKKCIGGDRDAWRRMKAYNRQDLVLLEKVYERLLPWMNTHPTFGMWKKGTICPKCGSSELVSEGWQFNKTMKYRKFSCKHCGGWGRLVKGEQIDKPLVSI